MNEPTKSQLVHHELPDDPRVLIALGKIALRHSQIDNQLRMLIMALASVTKHEALDATQRDGSAQLRDRVRKLARRRLGDGNALVRLQALLTRVGRLTDKRNELVHRVWGTELDGGPVIRDEYHSFIPAPTVAELESIHEQMDAALDDLIIAREEGFLAEALQSSNENI